MWVAGRASCIETFEVEPRRAEVAKFLEPRMMVEETAISSNVVSYELTEDREPGRDARIIRFPVCIALLRFNIHHRPGSS